MASVPAPPEDSSWANCFSRVAPLVTSSSSLAASVLASSSSTFLAIRSKVSKALLLPEMLDIVLFILSCASARLDLAMRMFFLREASSILFWSSRSETLSFSTSPFGPATE